jgi:hypothetical protein
MTRSSDTLPDGTPGAQLGGFLTDSRAGAERKSWVAVQDSACQRMNCFLSSTGSANVRLSPFSRNTLLAHLSGLIPPHPFSVFPQFRKSGRLRITSLPRRS